MKLVFKNETFSFEFIRTLGHAVYGGADIGECVATAQRIKDKDLDSWYTEWFNTAKRVNDIAEACEKKGNKVSAREAYLRASNYYRVSEFFLRDDANDAKARKCCRKSRGCFVKAGELGAFLFESVKIPYEDKYLPGYFLTPDDSKKKRPTLIAMTGYDGTAEELYFNIGAAAIRRGYNVLLFEGPGQGAALREQHLYFIPEWEKAITPTIDYLLKRPEVNKEQIAVAGFSLGGYLAPRAAAFDHRIAACIANSGIYDFYEGTFENLGRTKFFQKELDKPKSFFINSLIKMFMQLSINVKWAMSNGMINFNVKTPHEVVKQYRKYTLKGIVHQIKCPVLICDSQEEHFFNNQAGELFEKLKCPKEFLTFNAEEGAGLHCQSGDELLAGQRILDWLDKTLRIEGV